MSKNILYVEDDELIFTAISTFLSSLFPTLQSFNHPKKAIEAVENGFIPDLIITDITMPYMNGFEMIIHLKENHNIDVPIIITSGNPKFAHTADIEDIQLVEFFQKPLDIRKLTTIIKENI